MDKKKQASERNRKYRSINKDKINSKRKFQRMSKKPDATATVEVATRVDSGEAMIFSTIRKQSEKKAR